MYYVLAVVKTTSAFSCKVYEILQLGCLQLTKPVFVFRLLQMSFSGGSSHHANSKKSLVFLLKFLSDLVPFEPPQYLKVDISCTFTLTLILHQNTYIRIF